MVSGARPDDPVGQEWSIVSKPRTQNPEPRTQNSEPKQVVIDAGDLLHARTQYHQFVKFYTFNGRRVNVE